MGLTSCCFSNKKRGMHVKIVHPGGRVELYDQPILASEILAQNPRRCVTSPDVFQRPWEAVVSPDTVLLLGHKFYVVPTRTLQKLRSNSPRALSSPYREDSPRLNPLSDPNSPKREAKRSRNGCLVAVLKKAKDRPEGIGRGRGEENLRKETKDPPRPQPRGSSPGTPSYLWQPSLTSIVEE